MNRFIKIVSIIIIFVNSISGQIDHKQVTFIKDQLHKKSIATENVFVTDHYTSKGITHTYYKDAIDGIPVYNSRGSIHYKNEEFVIVKHDFKRRIKGSTAPENPIISAIGALERVLEIKGYDKSGELNLVVSSKGIQQKQTVRASHISLRDINMNLEYYYDTDSNIRLIWQVPVEEVNTAWFTNYIVDAITGEILDEVSWTVECNHGTAGNKEVVCNKNHSHNHEVSTPLSVVAANSYDVYAWPVESPNFGVRTTETSPWLDNAVASPNGWHTVGANNYTTTRGNNTDTYLDDDNTNSPTNGDDARAEGGVTLDFAFPLDVDLDPADFKDAAITNTFYWTNLMHDIWYNYGFDEASGNFQEENYTANGSSSDYVLSEAQDGGGTCNANFSTPPDGGNPRMQMFLCNGRDGDFDNGVIAHEFGHGISNRLTGGPAAAGCLGNQEQMGEGWSDYLGMVMTIEIGDDGPDSRGMGTWLFGEGPDGDGIRPYPYSTDFGVNPMTYDNVKTESIPHGVGSVWCTMLWDMTWAFINEYGFDPDLYNGTLGNNMAMQLVMEGMKLQPCSPGFVDGRDAILEADMLINGGANQCMIWKAFADRGLGYSAEQNSTGSRSDGVEAFDFPPSCSLSITKATGTESAKETDQITYEIVVENNFPNTDLTDLFITDVIPNELSFVSATNGGTENGGIISWPLFDLLSSQSVSFTVILEVKTGLSYIVSDIYDDIESGTANWATTFTGSTNWATQNTVFNSGTTAWFAPDNSTEGTAYLDLAFNIGLGGGAELSFEHQFDTEVNWDGGQVFISTDGGSKWIDLGLNMTNNGYNDIIFNSIPGFSGNSNGFINTIIDLDNYAGQNVLIRFQMNCDQAVGGNGWWIDDVAITNLQSLTINQATVSNNLHFAEVLSNAVELIPPVSFFQATVNTSDIVCNGDNNGEILTTPQGGSGAYTYLWNDGVTTQNRFNLSGGLYRVTISDGIDDIVKVGVISEPEGFDLTFEVDEISNLTGDNGTIEVLVEGGVGGYTYLWSNGDTTSELENLSPDTYVVTVTDANNCFKVDSVELEILSCGDDIFDSGGAGTDYSNGEDRTVLICSDSPNEDVVLTFNSLDVEETWDALYVHNGNTINSPIFDSGNAATQAGFPAGGYYGTVAPGPFAATNESGCITLRFLSDQFVTGDGWDVSVSCALSCAAEVQNLNPSGYGSLKQQVLCADPVDVITIGSDVFSGSIILDSTIMIDKELIIDPGVNNNFDIISNQMGPIFNIATNGSLALNNMALISGESVSGGAIINNGTLILNTVTVKENENTPNPQSLIQNNGQMTVTGNSEIIKD